MEKRRFHKLTAHLIALRLLFASNLLNICTTHIVHCIAYMYVVHIIATLSDNNQEL